MLKFAIRFLILLSLPALMYATDEQPVTIKLDMDIVLRGTVIGEDDWTLTILNESGKEINVRKYEILEIRSGREDVTAQYLKGGQLEMAQQRRQEHKKERLKSLLGVAALFIVFVVFSQMVLTTGGGDSSNDPNSTSHED